MASDEEWAEQFDALAEENAKLQVSLGELVSILELKCRGLLTSCAPERAKYYLACGLLKREPIDLQLPSERTY